MSAISFTNHERIAALQVLGYSEREASFLCLAALHGGYFLRRQFAAFAGQESAGMMIALRDKLLSKKHAVMKNVSNRTIIYHLASRPFYAAIGEIDNRNRREHAPLLVKNRLMGLDFVLANRSFRYLATEIEKLDYFTETLSMSVVDLPSRKYLSLKSPSTTTHYFVDKFPLFLKEVTAKGSGFFPCFCFVDEGAVTLSGFETYMEQYGPLWRRLTRFELIYIAEDSLLFAAAKRRFTNLLAKLDGAEADTRRSLAQRLIEHFEARFHYESKAFDAFDRDKLIRLRNESVEFSRPELQALFETWKIGGAKAVFDEIAPGCSPIPKREAAFAIRVLEHPYELSEKVDQLPASFENKVGL